ncbi:curli production assembly/transport protein CsgE [Photobacterium galatheae]|uniref:curli production assembly/transport protein CsgE n=1 Tax=Photobacterium galatheae TaxID=1654360 RepID=UPI00202CB26A|nr:curli production assembly/transport protein CsgE [Photobacterium galatheae]MCM0147299.1 curli production assembly/transport protein CsgE [Photobacterium galatheae]
MKTIQSIAACLILIFSNGLSAENKTTESAKPLENGRKLENGQTLESDEPLETKGRLENLDSLREISGAVIDRTMTRLGEEFYSLFAQKLEDQLDELKENLSVKERPTALSGSIISIYHRQNLIYRTAISPGRKNIEDKADQAVSAVRNYVLRWRVERYLQDTFDVDYDEI